MRPTHVLFNGGVFKADVLRARLLDVLGEWFAAPSAPQLLEGEHDLDHAAARGAAYYGWTKHAAACASAAARPRRTTWASRPPAWPCPARRGRSGRCASCPSAWKKAAETDVPGDEIGLVVGEPAQFRFFSSSARSTTSPATCCPRGRRTILPKPIRWKPCCPPTNDRRALRARPLPVAHHRIGRAGAMVRQHASDKRWKLEFSVREDAEKV